MKARRLRWLALPLLFAVPQFAAAEGGSAPAHKRTIAPAKAPAAAPAPAAAEAPPPPKPPGPDAPLDELLGFVSAKVAECADGVVPEGARKGNVCRSHFECDGTKCTHGYYVAPTDPWERDRYEFDLKDVAILRHREEKAIFFGTSENQIAHRQFGELENTHMGWIRLPGCSAEDAEALFLALKKAGELVRGNGSGRR